VKKHINVIIIFYVIYFSWLFLLTYLWPDQRILTFFLIIILIFYFALLYEKYDLWLFLAVLLGSYLIGVKFEITPLFYESGYPPLGLPYWPAAWALTSLAMRKFFLLANKTIEHTY